MKKTLLFVVVCVLIAWSCETSYDAREQLTGKSYDRVLIDLAPYVVKKPDALTYENRFNIQNRPFYKNFIDLSHARLSYCQKKDTAVFFSFVYQDLTSLREHFRVVGGYYKTDKRDSIIFVNLLYHTPRFTADQLKQRDKMLFESMVSKGNVDRFLGNKQFINTPNKDFYYNARVNRWDYTENSSWRFLDSAKQQAMPDSIP